MKVRSKAHWGMALPVELMYQVEKIYATDTRSRIFIRVSVAHI